MDKEILKVINQDPWLKLHALLREGYLSGRSIRSMALEYGCAYNTASKYAKGLAVPWERKRRVRTRTVLTPQLVARIGELLRGGEHSGRRRLTARRIHAQLCEEGLTASYSSVHQEVRRQKTALEAQGFIPLSYAPGEKLQVDFGEYRLRIAGEWRTLHSFTGVLCHSQYPLARLFTAQNEECFLEGLSGFMRELGGVPRQVIFDNARVAVRSGSGAGAQLNERYARLAAHYGFEAVSCNAHAGHEKGLVEGLVGYIRRNFAAAPQREYATLEEAQESLRRFLERRAQTVLRGRERSIAADFERERSCLRPLPEHEPEVTVCRSVRVNAFSRVRFACNEYSVPGGHEGQLLTLHAGAELIRVCCQGTCVAVHWRLKGRGGVSDCLAHFLPRLLARPRALPDAAVVRQVLSARERGELLCCDDPQRRAALLQEAARRQLREELPPQEDPQLQELLAGTPAAEAEEQDGGDLHRYDELLSAGRACA